MNEEKMNEAMNNAWKKAGEAFDNAENVFSEAEKRMNGTFSRPTDVPKDSNIRLNFTHHRVYTFFKFIRCAFGILFRGKTTLTVKRR